MVVVVAVVVLDFVFVVSLPYHVHLFNFVSFQRSFIVNQVTKLVIFSDRFGAEISSIFI